MNQFTPTYLYIKTHNITGLKYFGKTIQDPNKYPGSGIYWKDHIRHHGNDVTTEVIGYYTDKQECEQAALQFSIDNDIINALNEHGKKVWANLIIENGLDGNTPGTLQSEETKRKRSEKLKGRSRPEETRKKISQSQKGKKISPEAIEKMKETKRNNPMSDEQRNRLSEMYTGRVWMEEEKQKIRGQIVVVDRAGNLLKMSVVDYKAQLGDNCEYVHFRTKEGKRRRESNMPAVQSAGQL
jgi:hypothetical protein